MGADLLDTLTSNSKHISWALHAYGDIFSLTTRHYTLLGILGCFSCRNQLFFLENKLGDTCRKSFYPYNRTNFDTDEAPKLQNFSKCFWHIWRLSSNLAACVLYIFIWFLLTQMFLERSCCSKAPVTFMQWNCFKWLLCMGCFISF